MEKPVEGRGGAGPSFRRGLPHEWDSAVTLGAAGVAMAGQAMLLAGRWQTALALFAAAAVSVLLTSGRRVPLPGARFPAGSLVLGIACVTALAALARLYRITEIPPGLWADETDLARAALAVRDAPHYVWDVIPHIEVAYLYVYLQAGIFFLLGVGVLAVKCLGVLGGILTAPFLFLLARQFLRDETALVVAGLWAVCGWAVNVSRWGHANSFTPLFICLVLWLVWRGIAGRRRWIWPLAGAAYGLSLYVYQANRATIVLALVLVAHAVVLGKCTRRWALGGLVLFLAGAAAVAGPLLATYASNPKVYLERTMAVSVFDSRFTPDPWRAIPQNAGKYALVLNRGGDGNPRHNPPGRPQLDLPLAALFLVGLAVATRSIREPGSLLALTWVGLYFGAGTLTTEAPNTFRVYGVLPGVLLLVGIAFEAIADASRRLSAAVSSRFRSSGRRAALVGALTGGTLAVSLVAVVGDLDLTQYFWFSAHDPSSFAVFNAGHTRAGQAIAGLRGPAAVYLDSEFYGFSQVDVLSPDRRKEPLRLESQLLPPAGWRHPVLWGFGNYRAPAADFLAALYSGAEERVERDPGGSVIFASVVLPGGGPDTGMLRAVALAGTMAYGAEKPAALGAEAAPGRVRWRGALRVLEAGSSSVRLVTASPTRLFINGELLLEAGGSAPAEAIVEPWLPGGALPIRIERIVSGADVLTLEWRPPGETRFVPLGDSVLPLPFPEGGLLAIHYEGPRLTGVPIAVRHDPLLIAGNFGGLSTYGERWVGEIDIPLAGDYEFVLDSDDAARLWLGDRLVVDDWALHSRRVKKARATLPAGRRPIAIDFLEYGGSYWFEFRWRTPGGAEERVPAAVLGWRPEQVAAALTPRPERAVALPVVGPEGLGRTEVPLARWSDGTGNPASENRRPRRDVNVAGFMLKSKERLFDHGVGVIAPTTLDFDLAARYATVSGLVGVERDSDVERRVEFRVVGDGRELWASGWLTKGDEPAAFVVDVRRVTTLQLVAQSEPGSGENAVDWLDVVLTRAAGSSAAR